MAGDGYIPDDLARRAQAEPLGVVAADAVKTHASAAVGSVLEELEQRGGDRFGVGELFLGRVSVRTTVDERVQTIVNAALENGLALYEQRHPKAKGRIQGSVVVLRNRDAAIMAEAGGREVYQERHSTYSDFNRVTESMRQPGSAWKPIVYLAAFRRGLGLDSIVPDEPIAVPTAVDGEEKWIANYDNLFKGPMAARQALAESRNTVPVWIMREIGVDDVVRTAKDLGIHSPVRRYMSMALGASEVRLLELAGAYRAIASGVRAEPYVIAQVTDASGEVLYRAAGPTDAVRSAGLRAIQEGLRGVVRIPEGTANSLDRRDFPIPVMGKTGTALRCLSSAKSCSASTATAWWGPCRTSRARSRTESTGISPPRRRRRRRPCRSPSTDRLATTAGGRSAGRPPLSPRPLSRLPGPRRGRRSGEWSTWRRRSPPRCAGSSAAPRPCRWTPPAPSRPCRKS